MGSPLKHKLSQSYKKTLPAFIITIIILLFSFYFLLYYCKAYQPIYIRVLVQHDTNSANLEIRGLYEILDGKSGILYKGKNLNATLLGYKDGILLGNINLRLNSIFIRSLLRNIVKIDGREFKGDIQVIKNKDANTFLVINYIELEDYIKGVLYHEASHHWPIEALKAQAVTSRTFALYQRQISKNKDYDVTADIYSQVYGGKTSERYRTNRAVKETSGKILVYKGESFPTYYSATCAGHTEDASNLWDIDIEPLKGIECRFCSDSPHFKWYREIPLDEIKASLNKSGLAITEAIKDISVIKKNKSGRVERIKIYFGDKEIEISGKDLRNIIGPNVIRSTNFSVQVSKNRAYFEGFGWGHGVGLCQWGAYFMAKQGYTYEQILKYYYPKAEVSLTVSR